MSADVGKFHFFSIDGEFSVAYGAFEIVIIEHGMLKGRVRRPNIFYPKKFHTLNHFGVIRMLHVVLRGGNENLAAGVFHFYRRLRIRGSGHERIDPFLPGRRGPVGVFKLFGACVKPFGIYVIGLFRVFYISVIVFGVIFIVDQRIIDTLRFPALRIRGFPDENMPRLRNGSVLVLFRNDIIIVDIFRLQLRAVGVEVFVVRVGHQIVVLHIGVL